MSRARCSRQWPASKWFTYPIAAARRCSPTLSAASCRLALMCSPVRSRRFAPAESVRSGSAARRDRNSCRTCQRSAKLSRVMRRIPGAASASHAARRLRSSIGSTARSMPASPTPRSRRDTGRSPPRPLSILRRNSVRTSWRRRKSGARWSNARGSSRNSLASWRSLPVAWASGLASGLAIAASCQKPEQRARWGEDSMTRPRTLRRRSLVLAASAVALGLLTFSPTAWSQRTIKVVVPFPPGGSADILARLIGEQVGRTQGVTVVTENRPGAGASIAYEAVARAAPDANTLVINGNSLVINPHLRKVNYDPLTSFEPVCYLVSSPQVYVVKPDSPYRTLNDLISAARAKPGEVTLASVGPATTQHIGFEQLKHAAKANVTYVPYSGGAPAMNALLGGHVAAAFANYSEAVEHIKAGKLRVLASASKTRIEPLPDVPTVAESGYKDYEVEVWF